MTPRTLPPEQFNPCPESTGMQLFELWESFDDGSRFLVSISGTAAAWKLRPGDTVVRRQWAPASDPVLWNEARA